MNTTRLHKLTPIRMYKGTKLSNTGSSRLVPFTQSCCQCCQSQEARILQAVPSLIRQAQGGPIETRYTISFLFYTTHPIACWTKANYCPGSTSSRYRTSRVIYLCQLGCSSWNHHTSCQDEGQCTTQRFGGRHRECYD
jgi:hypothetical protein